MTLLTISDFISNAGGIAAIVAILMASFGLMRSMYKEGREAIEKAIELAKYVKESETDDGVLDEEERKKIKQLALETAEEITEAYIVGEKFFQKFFRKLFPKKDAVKPTED